MCSCGPGEFCEACDPDPEQWDQMMLDYHVERLRDGLE